MIGVPKLSRRYYPGLTGLRALAVLAVFGFHYIGTGFGLGWIGVDFFFVLSGFLITGILLDAKHDGQSLRPFFLRRMRRIFPLYYTVILLAVLYGVYIHARFYPQQALYLIGFGNYAGLVTGAPLHGHNMTTLTGDRSRAFLATGHLWSLCVEEQFYLAWPWIVYRYQKLKTLLHICAVLLCAAPLIRLMCFLYAPKWMLAQALLYTSLPTRMDALVMGGVVAILLRTSQKEKLLRHRRWLLLASAAPVILGGAYCAVRNLDTSFSTNNAISAALMYTVIDVCAAAVVLTLTDEKSRLTRSLSWRPLLWLGTISYGFYIFHELPRAGLISLALQKQYSHPVRFVALMGLLISTAGAAVSYRFFETPFLRKR